MDILSEEIKNYDLWVDRGTKEKAPKNIYRIKINWVKNEVYLDNPEDNPSIVMKINLILESLLGKKFSSLSEIARFNPYAAILFDLDEDYFLDIDDYRDAKEAHEENTEDYCSLHGIDIRNYQFPYEEQWNDIKKFKSSLSEDHTYIEWPRDRGSFFLILDTITIEYHDSNSTIFPVKFYKHED